MENELLSLDTFSCSRDRYLIDLLINHMLHMKTDVKKLKFTSRYFAYQTLKNTFFLYMKYKNAHFTIT